MFGYSFSDLIVSTMARFAAILDASVVTLVVTTLDGILGKFVEPGYTELLANIIYFTVFFFVSAAKVISLIIIGFSLFAQAVLVLVGPLFCSLFLVPHFKRYFFGWMDSLIQVLVSPGHRLCLYVRRAQAPGAKCSPPCRRV